MVIREIYTPNMAATKSIFCQISKSMHSKTTTTIKGVARCLGSKATMAAESEGRHESVLLHEPQTHRYGSTAPDINKAKTFGPGILKAGER